MAERKKPGELEIPSLSSADKRGSRFIARRPNILHTKRPQGKDAETVGLKLNRTTEIVSPRKSTSFDLGAHFVNEGFAFDTFKSFHDKQSQCPPVANDTKIPSVLQFYHDNLNNILLAIGLTEEQRKGMFSHLDLIMTLAQHQSVINSPSLPERSILIMENVIGDTSKMVSSKPKIASIILLQKVVRFWLIKKLICKYSKENILRLKVRNEKFNELVKLESRYVGKLTGLIYDYLLPLRKHPMKGVDAGSLAHIFSNVEDISGVHEKLLGALVNLQNDPKYPFIFTIGKIVLEYAEKILPLYGSYVENHQIAMDTLDLLCTEVPKFQTFLDETRSGLHNGSQDVLTCKDKLTVPLQHIPQYETILQEILSFSTPTDPGYEDIVNACTILGKVADLIRTKLDASARIARFVSVERRIEVDKPLNLFDNPKRILIREAIVPKVDDKKNATIFLFNDLLIIAESGHSGLKFYKKLYIAQTSRLVDISKDKNKYAFAITSENNQEAVIHLKSGPEKAAWMADIITIIDAFQKKRVFGVSLSKVLNMEKRDIPLVCELTVENLRARALDVEGIFRVPGDAATIGEMKRAFDTECGQELDLSKFTVHDVSGLLKLFFRELSEPLFPCSYFLQLVNLQRDLENHGGEHSDYFQTFLEDLAMIIASLQRVNQKVLFFLIGFLKEISEQQEVNKMTSRNLAVVFAPNIIRPREDTIETAMLSPQISKLFDYMIEHYKLLDGIVEAFVAKGTINQTQKILSPKISIVEKDSESSSRTKKRNLANSGDKRKTSKNTVPTTKKREQLSSLRMSDDKSQLPADLRARASTLTDFINAAAANSAPVSGTPSDSEHRISRSPAMKKKVAETPR